MMLHFLNDVVNDVESTRKAMIASLSLVGRMNHLLTDR